MNALETAHSEFIELGLAPQLVDSGEFGGHRAIIIAYPVQSGRFKGQTWQIGISFQEEGYPEYPPHFVHVTGLSKPKLPVHSSHQYGDTDWYVFSVPPSDFWDDLPTSEKNMKTYIHRHLQRFWDQI